VTAPHGYSGIEPVTAEGIHEGGTDYTLKAPFTNNQMRGIADSFMYRIGATILYWLAGIEVLGGNPFGFLRTWADDLQNRANDAYTNAQTAQFTAEAAQDTGTHATNEVSTLKARVEAGSGDYFTDPFDYANSDLLPGLQYAPYTIGSGAGTYGPNGNGELQWKISGFGTRYLLYVRSTFMVTSGQFGMSMVISKKQSNNGPAVYLGAVDSTTGDGIVLEVQKDYFAVIPVVGLALIGSGTYHNGSTSTADGDLFELYYGATVGGVFYPQAVYIKRNSATLWSTTDVGAAMTTSMIPLLGATAVGSGFTQLTPARMTTFSIFDSTFTV
jgi:hypothetical protein